MRRALALAIDRQTIVDTVLQGQGVPAYRPVPARTFRATKPITSRSRATSMKRQAGCSPTRAIPTASNMTLRTDQDETENRVLNAIAATAAPAGITFNVNSTEASVYTQDRTACTMEMGGIRWALDYPDPENMVVQLLPNATSRINCGYGTVDVAGQINDLYTQGISMPFGADRDAVFQQLEKVAMDNVLIIPIYNGAATRLVSSRLGGMPIDNNGTVRFALMEVQS